MGGPATDERWGRYVIEGPMRSGGMGELLVARAEGLGGFEKRVVLKRLLPDLSEEPALIRRFLQEARIAAQLEHPNIALVYDAGEHDGVYFFSMELIDGFDLRRVLREAQRSERALAFGEVAAIGIGLCAGLHHAHEKRDTQGRPLELVHRDVSPGNVLISREGIVKLVDFGIAQVKSSLVTTVAGRLRGKVPYMSPEQARGEPLDRRSDVYTVGLLLWEMVTGRRAIADDNEITMLRRVAERPVTDVRKVEPDCPEALAEIIDFALVHDREARCPTALALQDRLEELVRAEGLRATRPTLAKLLEELFADEEPAAAAVGADDPTATHGAASLGIVLPLTRTTVAAPQPRRQRRTTLLTAGLGVGLAAIAVAFVASDAAEPTSPEASSPRPAESGTLASVPEPEPTRDVVRTEPAPEQPEVHEQPEPEEVVEEVVDAAVEAAAPEPTKRSKTKRRHKSRKRSTKSDRAPATQSKPTAADLHSPLPPGFGR